MLFRHEKQYIIAIVTSIVLSLPEDPVSVSSGSADPSLPPAGPLSHDVVSGSADMTLYVVFLLVFPSQSSTTEKIASLIH